MTTTNVEAGLREELTPFLDAGEQLLAVGGFQSGGNWMELPKATFFTMRDWAVGITDKRVILAKRGRLNQKLMPEGVFSVPRESVVAKGRILKVKSPNGKVPKRLRTLKILHYDRDMFTRALSS